MKLFFLSKIEERWTKNGLIIDAVTLLFLGLRRNKPPDVCSSPQIPGGEGSVRGRFSSSG